MYEAAEDHCRRCGADRSTAIQQELRDMCPTAKGDDVSGDEMKRMVKPIFEPKWGKVQWYELEEGERRKARRVGESTGDEDEDADPQDDEDQES